MKDAIEHGREGGREEGRETDIRNNEVVRVLYVSTVLVYYCLVRFTLVRLCWYDFFLIWFCGLDWVVLGKGCLVAGVGRMGAGGMDD